MARARSHRSPGRLSGQGAPGRGATGKHSWPGRIGFGLALLTIVAPSFLVEPGLKEAFRLPKLFGSELLALASLVFLLPLCRAGSWRALAGSFGLRAVLPLLVCAAASLLVSEQPAASRDTLRSFAIGALVLVVWSLAIRRPQRLVWATLVPASALAAFGLFQHATTIAPPTVPDAERLQLTSLAGSVGDFASYLVLPLLLVQLACWRRRGAWPWLVGWGALGALLATALVVAQTQVPLFALAVGSVLLWLLLAQRRRRTVAILGGFFAVTSLLVLVSPAGERLKGTATSLREQGWNAALSGRLDGWSTAWYMAREHPILGVGQGAFGERYGEARLRMPHGAAAGATATFHHRYPIFGNAHNDYLEVAAELGLLGLLALGFGLSVVVRQVRRRWLAVRSGAAQDDRGATAFAAAALAAYGVMALGYFPLRIALTAYPALALLAWVLAPGFAGRPDQRAGATAGPPALSRWRGALGAAALTAAAAFLLVVHWQHVRSRITASRGLRRVEVTTASELRGGQARPEQLRARIELLQRLQPLDPGEVGIPLAIGSHFLLLQNAGAAIRWYEEALRLEVRPELLANLGRAYRMAGDAQRATRYFDQARQLDPLRFGRVEDAPVPTAGSLGGGG